MTSCTTSGSRSLARAVKPTVSAKSTVTCLRSPSRALRAAENLVGQVSGGIRRWGGNTGCRRWRLRQIVATGVTEAAPRRIHLAACRAYHFEFGATGVTEQRSRWIRVLTLWTVHGVPPPCRRGFLHSRPRRWSIAMAGVQTISHVTTAPPRVQVPSGSLVLWPILAEDSLRHHAWQKRQGWPGTHGIWSTRLDGAHHAHPVRTSSSPSCYGVSGPGSSSHAAGVSAMTWAAKRISTHCS